MIIYLAHEQEIGLVEATISPPLIPDTAHGLVMGEIYFSIRQHARENDLGFVTLASGCNLFKNPEQREVVYAPDVGFVAKDRLPNGLPEGYLPLAPDLAIEIIAFNDRFGDIEDKISEYLRAGTRLVWVISPRSKMVIVYTKAGVIAYDMNGTLDGGDVLPGFKLPVAAIFRR